MVMSAHMRRQLLIGGKGRYVASRVAAHPPMPMQRGSQRPPSAPRKVNRRTAATRPRGRR